ncbi:MAG: aspartate--tRNA(Asn) ligase [Candidatus Dormibacteria bacterium]
MAHALYDRIWTAELAGHVGERVVLRGWLHRFRQLSEVSFLIVRDARGIAQVVITDPAVVGQVASLVNDSVIAVTGTVTAVEQAPNGVELHDPEVVVLCEAEEPPPFDLYRPVIKAQLPTILDAAPVALRHPRLRAYFQMQAASMAGFRHSLEKHSFTEIQTPKIVSSATESGATTFTLDYFGRRAYLAQSPQFYKQIMVGVFERVYEVGPVFRAEPHDTARHVNEYVSLDAEMGFIDDEYTVMSVLTTVLAGMMGGLEGHARAALDVLKVELPDVPDVVPDIHFSEAQALITAATGEDLANEPDLSPANERWLGEWALREHNSAFVFIRGYPIRKRPFYTHPDPSRPGFSRGFDLLFRGVELVTGGQRLHRYADYVAALTERGDNPEHYAEYLMAFRHGMPPHGGFAIGLERFVARLVNAQNIRETTLFPRDINRLAP